MGLSIKIQKEILSSPLYLNWVTPKDNALLLLLPILLLLPLLLLALTLTAELSDCHLAAR